MKMDSESEPNSCERGQEKEEKKPCLHRYAPGLPPRTSKRKKREGEREEEEEKKEKEKEKEKNNFGPDFKHIDGNMSGEHYKERFMTAAVPCIDHWQATVCPGFANIVNLDTRLAHD